VVSGDEECVDFQGVSNTRGEAGAVEIYFPANNYMHQRER